MKLRVLSLFTFLIAFSSTANCQDTIRLKNGTLYIAEIVEVADDYFLYKKSNWEGKDSILKANKSTVHSIRYKGGYEDVFGDTDLSLKMDLVKFTNAREVEGRILEVGEKGIVFRLSTFTSDSIKTLAIDSIAFIRYANGYLEKYNEVVLKNINGATVSTGNAQALKVDTVRLVNGKYLVGFISEIEEESVLLASVSAADASVSKVAKSSIGRIIYANGYVENYNMVAGKSKAAEEDEEADTPKEAKESKKGKAIAKKEPEKKEKKAKEQPVVVQVNFPQYSIESLNELPVTTSISSVGGGQKIRSLDLSGKSLLTIDGRIYTMNDLLVLNLNNNRLKELPQALFSLPRLYSLSANNCVLRKVEDMPKVTDSIGLAYISLNNNKLGSVDASLFQLPNLQFLDLSKNEIKGLGNPGKKAVVNTTIQGIDLSYNRLKDVPKVLPRLTSLVSLDLSFNGIKNIDFSPFLGSRLENLSLANNPLASLDPSFYDLKTIKYLDISGTQVRDLTDSIAKLDNLATLWLPDRLRALPAGLKFNKNLKELGLIGNPNFSSFPASILALTRLETLALNGTKVRQVPDEISRLKRLKILSLSNCGLTEIPTSLFELPRLQKVDLSANNITSIAGPLGSLDQLEQLNLENSPLNQQSLLRLKKSLPYASIKYFSPELGLNYESKPVAPEFQSEFVTLLNECEKGNTKACYELGKFFENSNDFGLAFKIYYRIAEELTREGSAQHALAYYKVAELFDDADNVRSYNSIYKRRTYSDFSDYKTNRNNNRALGLYCKLCEEKPDDQNAYKTMQQACAKASLIYNELQKNLKKLFDYNRSEVERLVGGAGTMANLSAGGDYLLNTSTTETEAVAGGLLSLIGTVGKSAKESKAERIQKETLELKKEIERLRELEEYYLNLKK